MVIILIDAVIPFNIKFLFVLQKTIESETVKTSEVIKKKLGEITGSVKEVQYNLAKIHQFTCGLHFVLN